MRVSADRVDKGKLKMGALTEHIQRFSQACRNVKGA